MSFSQAIPDKYLGLTPPGYTPIVFAPELVSLSTRNERVITFSPSGHEIFFAIGDWPTRSTLYIEYINNAWTSPVVAPFSTDRSAEETIFSPNGNRVYFYSYLPSSSSNSDICYSEKTGSTWGTSVNVGTPPNSTGDEYHPCVVNDGSIYFINSIGKICRSQYSGGVYQARVLLPSNINDATSCYRDPYVAADESYIIFSSTKAGGFGNYDLYISFRNFDGSWTTPQNFGNTINTSAHEGSADITPDGKYMTFDRIISNNCDIYWVAVENTIAYLRSTSGVITSVNLDVKNQDIIIYPNPSSGKINITLGTLSNKTIVVEISNLLGTQILSKTYNDYSAITIDLTGNAKGVYLLNITIDGKLFNKKIYID